MNKHILKPVILSVLAGFSGTSIQAIAGEQPGDLRAGNNETAFSARGFCRSGEGNVTETTHNNIYLCCYEAKGKCLAIDTQKSISWAVAYSTKDIANVDLSLGFSYAY
jgi:hypothetical protein